jgi:YbgC/YbaW family acyl-CoA thioester hydrolase
MNRWLRLIYFFIAVRFRSKVHFMEAVDLPFLCWPADLDIYNHMNNSRYLNLTDICRADLVIRCGLWDKLKAHKYFLIVEGQTVRYRKPLTLGQRFVIRSQVLGWNEKSFFVKHTFMRKHEIVAESIVKGRILRKARGTVPPAEVLKLAGAEGMPSPDMGEIVRQWNDGMMEMLTERG